MRILVTGGAGFIASHLVDRLLEGGHQVAVVDNLETGNRENLNPAAEFHLVDVYDREALEAVFKQFKPQVVNHHAAQMNVVRSVREPVYDARINVIGTLNLLELSEAHGVERFMFASTGGAVYGNITKFPADEDHPVHPLSPYGASKGAVELYLGVYSQVKDLPVTIFRYPNVYGPRQSARGEAGVVAIFSQMMLQGKTPRIFGDGSKTRDYVFVQDIVRASLIALEKNVTGLFNLGWGVEVSDFDIFEAVRRAAGVEMEPIYEEVRPGEVYRVVLDASRAKSTLGWEPRVSLDEGVGQAVEFYRDHLDW
jgi:UDP-glucose 4-epimerase